MLRGRSFKVRWKFNIICVGKTKEAFIKKAIEKYLGLISPHADVSIYYLKEGPLKDLKKALKKDAEKILKIQRFVLLDERGKLMNSHEFASFIEERREINFVIGGPYGVSEETRKGARMIMSLSPMTFSHELVRVMLLEQLYRAISIIKELGYHH